MQEQSDKKEKIENKKKRERKRGGRLCYIHNVYFAKVLKSVSMCSDFPTNRSVKASIVSTESSRIYFDLLKVFQFLFKLIIQCSVCRASNKFLCNF